MLPRRPMAWRNPPQKYRLFDWSLEKWIGHCAKLKQIENRKQNFIIASLKKHLWDATISFTPKEHFYQNWSWGQICRKIALLTWFFCKIFYVLTIKNIEIIDIYFFVDSSTMSKSIFTHLIRASQSYFFIVFCLQCYLNIFVTKSESKILLKHLIYNEKKFIIYVDKIFSKRNRKLQILLLDHN